MKTPEGWEIPQLDPALQATEVIAPVATWGTIGRDRHMPGTYCFYTDDYRFTGIWKHPALVVRSGCKVATEVNFSTFDDFEPEEVLKGIYRKRVLARYWQQCGIRILVDLDLAENYVADFALLGVPEGWKAYCTRSHRLSQFGSLELEYEVAVKHAGKSEILFVVFGGGKKVRSLVEERGWVSVPEHIEVVRGRAEPYGGVTATSLWKGRPAGTQEPPP
jgi:hypothetical protein